VKIRPKNFKKVLSNEGYALHTPTLRKPKFRFIRVICVPRRDGGAVSYAVAGIAELCDLCVLCGDSDANISSSCKSLFFIIFNPEMLRYRYV